MLTTVARSLLAAGAAVVTWNGRIGDEDLLVGASGRGGEGGGDQPAGLATWRPASR